MFKNINGKFLVGSLGALALSLLAFGFGSTALAAGSDDGMISFENGRDFGQHISEHAREGHLGADMNPGQHHQGFSPWAGQD